MVFQKPLNNFRYIVYYCHTKIKKNKQKETVTKVLSQFLIP
ncbi:ribonuclease P, partial [Enterococcus faecium]|nr:ribonuclease P [Enterococcus faecium]